MKWALTDGQKFAPELGYAPLPATWSSSKWQRSRRSKRRRSASLSQLRSASLSGER